MAIPYANAISGIESGGRYDLLGPVTRSGDRAYGRYQVMGSNIPDWTKQYFGQSLTPQEFLNNPAAQDAVFQGQFGRYVQKYGPEGAARAWFAGEGGMNNPNAKDALGATVADYSNKFTTALGDQPQATIPSYDTFGKPPLVPGTAAPPLPPPINIGGTAAPQGLLAAAPNASPAGLLGGMNQLASLGMGLMGGGNDAPPQPYIAPPVRPRVDMTPLLSFLQGRAGGLPASWSV